MDTIVGRRNKMKIMSVLTILVVGFLVLSGVGMAGVTTVTYNKTTTNNHPPDKPHVRGPAQGKVGVTYVYYFAAVDPDGDNVSYYIDWGDGTRTGWTDYYESGLLLNFNHTWNKMDHYLLRAKAKDIYGFEGDWGMLPVLMSQNSQQSSNPLFFQIVQRLLNIR
jgi:hypothetical protein